MKERILITGSEGFIGRVLQTVLTERGYDFVCIDRRLGTEASDIDRYLSECNFTAVVHLAAQTSVYDDNIKQIAKDNIEVFIDICLACVRHGVKLVYASSSTAFEANTTSVYGMTKHFAENFAKVYCPDATGLRFYNVYGFPAGKGTLLAHLLDDNEDTLLYNNGENVRCYTWVGDVVEAIIKALKSREKLLNVVNRQPITTECFAKLLSRHREIRYHNVNEIREFDKSCQYVDDAIPVMAMGYHKVEQVFADHYKHEEK